MEPDRYKQNRLLFIVSMTCLLLCLTLLAFAFYILPYLLWSWGYKIPAFIQVWREWLYEGYNFSKIGAAFTIFLIFFLPGIIAGYISEKASNSIDNEMYGLNKKPDNVRQETDGGQSEGMKFTLRILILMFLAVIVVFFIEWLIANPAIPSV